MIGLILRRVHALAADRGPEVAAFLAVGGLAFIVDVALFNVLRGLDPFRLIDPTVARSLAMLVAMCVTYTGNRTLTWRGRPPANSQAIGLFVLLNLVGLGISDGCLAVSHDVLGFTSPLADNVAANGVGLALGTAFRYLTYRRFVFAAPTDDSAAPPKLHAYQAEAT